MPVKTTKRKKKHAPCYCIANNAAIIGILDGAISCQTDQIADDAQQGLYGEAADEARDLAVMLDALDHYHRTNRKGRR